MTVQSASIIFDSPPASICSRTLTSPTSGKQTKASALIGSAAHGVDVAQRVGGGNLSEDIGVIDDGREEVDRLHERQLGRELIHSGVVGCVEADQNVRIMLPG